MSTAPLLYAQSASAFIVFDIATEANTGKISETSENILIEEKITSKNTTDILKTDKEILDTVKKTLEAITGDRKKDADSVKNTAVGKEFSASDAKTTAETATKGAIDILADSIKVEFETAYPDSSHHRKNEHAALEAQAKTTFDMSALIKGINEALKARKAAYEKTANTIGNTHDIKGSIDQNSQIQVQNGLVLNELIGVNNSILSANQADNQRRVTDVFNSIKSMSYNDQ